ncbi:alpha-tubulin suppressor-like RCC1 family protein [Paenibacillus turicensis]|uniref:Alpha-tubulin suppressor-like RCC1 family protein n=1 Tax=Paenibacillus turicensis TaxID=160487 RepID=A0ABS4FSQ6_9BACL|nr:alpha-tubulin suppressor-like RCC1 family protein [Paenibacillus turicensis]
MLTVWGGVVATEYLNQGNRKDVDKLITIGTPFLGAPKAAYIFETGNATGDQLNDFIVGKKLKSIMRNISSAYQLLPNKSYFSVNKTYYISKHLFITYNNPRPKKEKIQDYKSTKTFFETETSWINKKLLSEAEEFHDNLGIITNVNTVDSYHIIGDKIGTIGGMTFNSYNNPGSPDMSITDLKTVQGDGTVPVISANVGGLLKANKTYYIQEEHSELPGNKNVQKQIENILEGNPGKLEANIRKSTQSTKTLKLKIECPVELSVVDSDGNHLGSTGKNTYEENIPFGSYYTDGETKIAFLNDGKYSVSLKGTGYGEMTYSLIWSNEEDIEEKTVRFDSIPVTPNSIFTSGTDRNGKITLQIDDNGDGTIDRTVTPAVELDLNGTQDETIPTISSHMDGVKGVNEWYGVGAHYNLEGKDEESGVYKIFYKVNDSETEEYINPIPLPNTGIYNFESFVRDKNRNDSEVLTETIKVDTTKPTKPTMTIEPLKWTNKFVSITLSNSTDADSGFQKYQYKINDSTDWIDYKEPVIISTEGLHQVYAKALDNVFNESETISGEAKVDKTPPSKPESIKTLIRDYEQIKISWVPSTDNVEVVGYDMYLNSKFVGTTRDTEYTFNNLNRNTIYTIKIVARDEAENSSEEATYIEKTALILLDSSANHSIRVKTDGSVWTWGNNAQGQLGDGTKTNKTTAVQVEGLSDMVMVAAGAEHSLALKHDGTVWTWGYGRDLQLGNGEYSRVKAAQIKGLSNVKSIAAGLIHGMALTQEGELWYWGTPYNNGIAQPMKFMSGVKAMSGGLGTTQIVKTDGTMWTMGLNTYGQLGDGTKTNRTIPVQVSNMKEVVGVAGGETASYAVKADGSVWSWGRNDRGQLGDGTIADRLTAVKVLDNSAPRVTLGYPTGSQASPSISNINYPSILWNQKDDAQTVFTAYQVQIMDGVDQILLDTGIVNQSITQDSNAWTVNEELPRGKALKIQVRVKDEAAWSEWSEPRWLKIGIEEGVVQEDAGLATSSHHVVHVKTDGSVWTWGDNAQGQLGDGTKTNKTTAVQVEGLSDMVMVGAGAEHSLALKHDGTVWTWGNNVNGQLGTGDTVSSLTPVQVPDLENVIAVTAGSKSSYALKQDGTVWIWGYGPGGYSLVKPEKINDLTGVSQIATNNRYALALKSDGTVWSWGDGWELQLGTGVYSQVKAMQIKGLSNVKRIAAGSIHGMALTQEGELWYWGTHNYNRIVQPTKLMSGVKTMSGGMDTTQIVKTDGTMWAMGLNTYGQLGDGTKTNRTIPVQVPNMKEVVGVAGGETASYAVKADGSIWAWGRNDRGQLGDGGLSESLIPIMVPVSDNLNTFSLTTLPSYFTVEMDNSTEMKSGQVTVTLSVYNADEVIDNLYTGISKLKITKYHTSNSNQLNVNASVEDIKFNEGIAYLPLTFDDGGLYTLNFELEGFNKQEAITLKISIDKPKTVIELVTLPSTSVINGEILDVQPVLRILDSNGEPIPGAKIVAKIIGDVEGTLLGNVHITSDNEGYITFEDLGVLLENSNVEIIINFSNEEGETYINSPMIEILESEKNSIDMNELLVN